MDFKILMLGDTVGSPGRAVIREYLTPLLEQRQIDFVVVNAENVAGGSGITPEIYHELRDMGVDVLTGGDHIYRKKEIYPVLKQEERMLRPLNFPEDAVGRGWCVVPAGNGIEVGVIHLLGRVFMQPVDCPFKAVEKALQKMQGKANIILVDMHAEATSEKIAMGRFLDGKVTAVVGSHTHVQTADEQIFPKGTAYITDLGMTGPHESILGRRIDRVLSKFLTNMPAHFDVATEDVKACGVLLTVDVKSGKTKSIERVRYQQK